MENIKILLVTQARLGSTRFPNKVTQKLEHTTLLGLHLERIKKSKLVTNIVVATTQEQGVESIIEIANQADVKVFQGNLNDVLDRFYQASLSFQPDYVVRVTSDCPLLDPILIDEVIQLIMNEDADYSTNMFEEEFPDGQDVEVFKFDALRKAWENAILPSEREHVTPFIRNNSDLKGGSLFKAVHFPAPANFNHIRMTIDEPKDLVAVAKLVSILGTNESWQSYTQYMIENISLFENQDITRNEGYLKSLKNDNH